MICHVMVCFGITCSGMLQCLIWHNVVYVILCSIDFFTPYNNSSCHFMLCYIVSYHIISYHIISYHIISYHIISYHIISYHIISYHIMSYYSILSNIILLEQTVQHSTLQYSTVRYRTLHCSAVQYGTLKKCSFASSAYAVHPNIIASNNYNIITILNKNC